MAIYKRGGVWWMDVYVGSDRRRVRRSTGCVDEVQARLVEQAAVAVNRGITTRQRAMAIVDAVLPVEGRSVMLVDVGEWYRNEALAERVVLGRLGWQKRMCAVRRCVQWMLDNTRAKTVEDVDHETAWQYAKAYGVGRSAKTQNNEVGQLRTVWAMLIKHGKAKENPWEGARAARRADEEKHGRAFTDEEVARILAAAREVGCEWEGVVTVALYTGLRKHDVEWLRWDEVDMAKRVIRKIPGKTARHEIGVVIPMHDEVVRVVEAARASTDARGEWVFPWRQGHPNGQRPKPGDVFFAEVLKRAGIVEGEGEHVTFHCLRHTFITRLAEAGVAQDVRMRLAGHTVAATNDLYTHDEAQARAAIERLG